MHSPAILMLGCLAASASAAAKRASDSPFEITNLTIRKVAMANTTLEFTVYDPDPLTNATSVCMGTWKDGSKGFPTGGYETCGNSTFQWNMQSFTSLRSFVLGIEHSYLDPAVGSYPYDELTNFGDANVTDEVITCNTKSGLFVCAQPEDAVIEAPIYATDAKRR